MTRPSRGIISFFFTTLLMAGGIASAQTDYQTYGSDGGSGGSCQKCYMSQQNQSINIYCGPPAPGEYGMQYCFIDSYPEGTYCETAGNQCCVD